MREPWQTDTVLILAQNMRDSGDFSNLPILADAMEDAGFSDIGVLHDARHDPNAGNWIVALALGEQEVSRKWLKEYVERINTDMRRILTVGELLESIKEGRSVGFGEDIPYGEGWASDEEVKLLRKHAEIMLKANVSGGEWFFPFRCAC